MFWTEVFVTEWNLRKEEANKTIRETTMATMAGALSESTSEDD